MRALAVVAISVLALLAGCSEEPTGDPSPANLDGAGPSIDLTPQLGELRFADLDQPLHHTVWANGTVDVQDTCNTGACFVDQARAFHRTDVTGHFVAGVPTLVSLELTWKETPLAFGWFDAYLEAPESTTYAARTDYVPGHLTSTRLLRPTGPLTLVMVAYGPGGDVPATSYTLSLRLDADPTALLPGVPVAVGLEGGDRLVASSYGGGKARFLLYGPDDALIGSFDGEHVLPAGAPPAAYVVVLPAGGPTGNLSTDSGASEMRALALRHEFGPVTDLAPNGAIDASWDVAGVPMGVGVYLHVDQDPQMPVMASSGMTARMTGPNGFELDAGEVCGLCITGGFGFSADSGSGDARVTAGTYSVHAESSATVGGSVEPFAFYLVR